MMCFHPRTIKHPYADDPEKCKYALSTKLRVPCGRCVACMINRRNQWFFRLSHECDIATSAYFITLTYNEESLPTDLRVHSEDCQKFLDRFRTYMNQGRKGSERFKIKYFLVSEYGGTTHRPHYHVLLFNYPFDKETLIRHLKKTWKLCDPFEFEMPDVVGDVTPASIMYVTKYCLDNILCDSDDEKTFMLCSNGIGANYLTPAMSDFLRSSYRSVGYVNGYLLGLPRYYTDKVYNIEDKFILANKKQAYHEKFMAKNYPSSRYGTPEHPKSLWFQERQQQERNLIKKVKNAKNKEI